MKNPEDVVDAEAVKAEAIRILNETNFDPHVAVVFATNVLATLLNALASVTIAPDRAKAAEGALEGLMGTLRDTLRLNGVPVQGDGVNEVYERHFGKDH